MPRRIDGWQTDKAPLAPPAGSTCSQITSCQNLGHDSAGDDSVGDESASDGSTARQTARKDAVGLAATDAGANCDCPDYRRDKVCDHVLMAAAVRMVRRMIDAHSDPDKPHH